MAPVATAEPDNIEKSRSQTLVNLKSQIKSEQASKPISASDTKDSEDYYEYNHLKPTWPKVDWPDLPSDIPITERALLADPSKKSLFAAAKKVKFLTPVLGVEFEGIDLRKLSNGQKDQLALLVAEKGVAFFRGQELGPQDQLALGRHFGPLHKHAVAPIPDDPALEELLVVYADKTKRPDPTIVTKLNLWHSDVSYEEQPPGITSLNGLTIPDVGGDTMWSSGYALYSSLSPGMQKYLEGLSAIHTGLQQAKEARDQGKHVRRQEIETAHPIVRVHPATGWKSIYLSPAVTTRIVGIPKAESDAILQFLFRQMVENPDFQVRFKWEKNSVVIWDNRISHHSAMFDFWPARRHVTRVTTHAERPLSVAEYEEKTGQVAKNWQVEMWKSQGIIEAD